MTSSIRKYEFCEVGIEATIIVGIFTNLTLLKVLFQKPREVHDLPVGVRQGHMSWLYREFEGRIGTKYGSDIL